LTSPDRNSTLLDVTVLGDTNGGTTQKKEFYETSINEQKIIPPQLLARRITNTREKHSRPPNARRHTSLKKKER